MNQLPPPKISLKLAIVGGGRACHFFLKLVRSRNLPLLDIDIIGVCDINPQAKGLLMAKQLGIYTTSNFKNLFTLKDLDGIIELTNNRNVLVDLIRLRPERIGIIEHNIGRLLRDLFTVDQKLRSAERQIVFEKAVHDFLIQQSRQCIVVINTDFTIDAVNDAYLKTVEKKIDEVIGAHCYRVIHGLDAPCDTLRNGIICPMVETLRTGGATKGIHSLWMGSQKAAKYHDVVTFPVKDAKGVIIRVIEIWMDIGHEIASRWEQREGELKSDLNKLIQEDRLISLGKLVASCVHEINNPIQGLLTFSHLMKEMLAGDHFEKTEVVKLREFNEIMANELERCGNIIRGLLSFSHESKKTFKVIDLNEVLAMVGGLVRHRIELQDLQFKMALTSNPILVNGNLNQLQQCFLNLVFNAIEAMNPGGHLDIVSSFKQDKQSAEVKIRDTGHGIPKQHLSHIYDPFFTTKPIGEGTGMGLSIVYGVVKHHRGKISVTSKVKKGTTFCVQFPVVESPEEKGP
jgi:signal transduction histidine kinase